MIPTNTRASSSQAAQFGIAVLCAALLAYSTARAITVSFSWDEAYTFLNHVRKGILYLSEPDEAAANHHLLNVWAMWLCMKAFGTSEAALRLPNLLAHVLYLYGSSRLALKAPNLTLAIAAFLLLNAHPYLLDFFSLARGYGLSMGMMMLSLWQLYRFADEGHRPPNAIAGIGFAAVSALAHTTMLNFLLGVVTAVVSTWLLDLRLKGHGPRWRSVFPIVLIVGACFAVVVPNALAMYNHGALFYGSDGPWRGMMGSLAPKFCYHFVEPLEPMTIMTAFVLVIGGWVVVVLYWAWRRHWNVAPLLLGITVAATMLLSIELQNLLMGILWPCTRTALFVIPLMSYLLVVALLSWRGGNRLPAWVALLLAVPLCLHVLRSANLAYSIEWRPSGEFKRILERVENDHLPITPDRPVVTICVGRQCSPSFAYYNFTKGLQWLVNFDPPEHDSLPRCDYYVVEWDAVDRIDHAHWSLLYASDRTGTALYRDNRMRNTTLRRHHESALDMESGQLVGTTASDHFGGRRCVSLDHMVRGIDTLEFAIATDWGNAQLQILGTAMVKQQDDSNWVALVIRLVRDGIVIEEGVTGSVPQTRQFNAWNMVSLILRPRTRMVPGDTIQFMVLPYGSNPPLFVDDMHLVVQEYRPSAYARKPG